MAHMLTTDARGMVCLSPVEYGRPQAGVQAKLVTLAALGRSVAVELGEQVAGVHRRGQGQTPWPLELLGPWTHRLGQQPTQTTAKQALS